ncbi:hypothetical protein BDD12DRAFT_805785 [Trichophaea hybrida]|nr:hypothetical protein BDD12DRAFT_805785 [Trichophaea hybrida]
MPVPFGFSVGDFLAVADLAGTISKAISESHYGSQIRRPRPDCNFRPVLLDGLQTQLDYCHKLMKDFQIGGCCYQKEVPRYAGDIARSRPVNTLTSFALKAGSQQKQVLKEWALVKE